MIELTRSFAFGQFINNGSALSRMDPRTKLFCAVLLIALVSYISNAMAFFVCFLLCIAIQFLSHIALSFVLRSFRPFVIFFLIVFCIEVLFYQNPAHTPLLWQWGIFSISQKAITISIFTLLRVVLLYYIISMLTFTTSLVDLTDGSEALLSPFQRIGIPTSALVMVMVIAFKFVPIFLTEVERLIKAQSARGVRFDQGNFMQRTTKLAPLMVPLFINGFKRASTLSVAMEARCYGNHKGWRRSKRRALHFERFDAFVLISTLAVCLVAILANIFAPFTPFAPFPSF